MKQSSEVSCPSQWEHEVLRDVLANLRPLKEGERVTFDITCEISGFGGSFGLYSEKITLRTRSGESPIGGQSQPFRIRIEPCKE